MSICQKYEFDLTALGRGEGIAPELRKAALEHAENCRHCSQKLTNEQRLTAGLAAVKEADERQSCVPERVEKALLAEFRKTTVPFPARRQRWRWNGRISLAAVVAAAAVILAIVAGWLKVRNAPLPSPDYAAKDARVYKAPVRAATMDSSEFLVLPYAPSLEPEESAEIYRVRVPRASLTGLGLPAGGRLDEPVEADLVVGQDGVARAIRFIR